MFVIASSGRCGTLAVCEGLNRFSDHEVRHEPAPRLLEEADLKHRGGDYRTRRLGRRLRLFARRADSRYGESFRGATLLPDIEAAAPTARFLVLVRPPLDYVASAHARRVLERGDEWDRTRILPPGLAADTPLAERLAWHWNEVNRYLLEFAEAAPGAARVGLVGRLEDQIGGWARFLGVEIRDAGGLASFLATKPNRSTPAGRPEGWDEPRLQAICEATWARASRLSSAD